MKEARGQTILSLLQLPKTKRAPPSPPSNKRDEDIRGHGPPSNRKSNQVPRRALKSAWRGGNERAEKKLTEVKVYTRAPLPAFSLDDIRIPGVLLVSGISRINFRTRCVVPLSCCLLMAVCTSDIGTARRFRCCGLSHQILHQRGSCKPF